MKGSAFKLGNVATKSALKMKSPLEQKTVKVDNTTYENPYTAYQTKNIPKKSTKGAPVAGGEVYSSISGIQVSGKGASNNARKRTDKFMKGEAQGSQGANTVSSDKNKDGLPDNFESTVSDKIKNNSKKTKTRADKIKAYQKSQLTAPTKKKKVTVEDTQDGTKTKKTITRTRKDGTVRKTKTIISDGGSKRKEVKNSKSRVVVQKFDKDGKRKTETVTPYHGSDVTKTKFKARNRKTRKSDTKK